jgi:hypothetical protein
MTNKDQVQKVANKLGLEIGCWDEIMELLSKKELNKILANIEYQEDTDVSIKRKKYVVEIDTIENEIDFSVLTKEEYINRYGDERYVN